MKNFHRRDSYGHHGSKRLELTQHVHPHGSHAFTRVLTSTQLQPRGAKCQISYYFWVHAGSFHVSVIYQTLTWTARSLTCVHYHSSVCVYTWGLGTPTASQHIFDSEKLTVTDFSCVSDGIRTFVLWILNLTLYQLSHPITPCELWTVVAPGVQCILIMGFVWADFDGDVKTLVPEVAKNVHLKHLAIGRNFNSIKPK